jgi:hypothetical protein
LRGKSGRNKIAKQFEETHKVKRRIYFVKRGFLQGAELFYGVQYCQHDIDAFQGLKPHL